MVLADIANSSLWEEVYTTSLEADRPYPNRFIPFGEILVPVVLDKPLIAAYVETSTDVNFRTAGWISKYVTAGLTVGSNLNTKADWSRKLFLDRPTMIQWESFNQNYKLIFNPWKQLAQVTFRVWKFNGEISELSDEQLAALRIDVLRIEKTLQFVAARDVPNTYDVDFEQ